MRRHSWERISWIIKSDVCSHQLDVQETDFCFAQSNGVDGIPALDLWDLVIEVLHSFPSNLRNPKRMCRRTCGMTHHHINTQRTKLRHNEQQNMRRRLIFLKRELFSIWCDVVHFWTMKQWSRRSSRARVQQWDTYPEPTELRLIGLITESIWTPKSKSDMLTPKTQLTDSDILIKGHSRTWRMEESSPSVQYQHYQLSKLLRSDVEKNATRNRRRCTIVAKLKQTLNLVSHLEASSPTAPSARASSRLIAQRVRKPAAGGSNQNDAVSGSRVANRCKRWANVRGNKPQEIPTSTTRTWNGRTTNKYLVPTFHISRKPLESRLQAPRIVPFGCPKKKRSHPQGSIPNSWFISSKRTRIKKRCKPTWSKIERSIHSASSRRKWSTAWSTSRFARSLPN